MHNDRNQNGYGSGWSINTVPSDLSHLLEASTTQDLFSILTPQRSLNSLASSSTALSSSLPTQFSLPHISYNQLLKDLTAKHEQQGSSASSVVTTPFNPILLPSDFSNQSLLQNAMNGFSSHAALSISSIPFDTQSVHSAVSRAKKRSITEMRRTSLPPHSIADDVSAHFQLDLPSTSQRVNSPLVDQPSTSREEEEIHRELDSALRTAAHEEFRRRPAPIIPDSFPRAPTPEDFGTLSDILPTHFFKGTRIHLPNGTNRLVEDLITDDFIMCATSSADLIMHTSTIDLIEKSVEILRVTVRMTNNEILSMDCCPEQPFFVIGHGWKSAAPDQTLERYGLRTRLLEQGDVCIILTSCEYTSEETRRALDSILNPREAATDVQQELNRFNGYQKAVKKLPKKSRKKRQKDRRRRREGRLSEPPPDLPSPRRSRRMKRSRSVDPQWMTSLPLKQPKPFNSPKNIREYPTQIAFDFEI